MEALLSTWGPDTELRRLNRAPVGEPHSPSRDVLGLLREADHWSRETGGAFDPRVGALVDAWDLRGSGRIPDRREVRRALAASGPEGIRLDFAARTVTRLDSAAWIDAGGFGKGAALRAASRALEERGIANALLDFGGQVVALGSSGAEEARWPVALAHPRRRSESVGRLTLSGVSAATSGTSERLVSVGDRTLGHLVDPRTGEPAPRWGSVTVVAPDPLVADILSTALFVLGPDEGMKWARRRDDVGVLFLVAKDEGDVRFRWNRTMEQWWDGALGVDAPDEAQGAFREGHDGARVNATTKRVIREILE